MMNNNETKTTESKVPNKAFDTEYSTQYKREYYYLKDQRIYPTIVKKTKDYGIPTYKYTKTPELFIALSAFYAQIKNEKQFNYYENLANRGRSFRSIKDANAYIEKETGNKNVITGIAEEV